MRRNLDLHRGESLTFSGVLRDSSGVVDISAATLTWRMGSTDGCHTSLSVTPTGDASGNWTVIIDPDDTDDLQPGFYKHQGRAVVGSTTYFFTTGRVRLRRDLPA